MLRSSHRRTSAFTAIVAGAVLALIALTGGAGNIAGQTQTPTPARSTAAAATASAPSSSAASSAAAPTGPIAGSTAASATQAGPTAAPALDDDTAVRMVLPASVNGRELLPGKWARADMPNAVGGYLIFISTIYPIYDGQGGATWYLLVNDLQWNGYLWTIGVANYPGQPLSGDDLWLAQNLTDITAAPSPAGQSWQVFTVAYTANALVNPTLSRTETVVEIYDLSLTTVWSRVDALTEIDSSNPNAIDERDENVNWTFQVLDSSGIASLVAAVVDTDTVTAGDGTASTTTSTTTEIWKWTNGVYVLQGGSPGSGTAPAATPRPASTARPSATSTPAPARATPTAAPTRSSQPAG